MTGSFQNQNEHSARMMNRNSLSAGCSVQKSYLHRHLWLVVSWVVDPHRDFLLYIKRK